MNLKKNLNSLFQKNKIKIIIFIIFFSLILAPLRFTFAALWDPVVKGLLLLLMVLVLGVISLIGFILGTLSKITLSMLTRLARWAAVARIGGLSYTKRDNPFIDAGLKVTLPLANMAFILIFVIIAIATILGVESYGIRKTLPVLIIMALLVNFAPVLVGIMVDAGNIITYYFIKGIDFTKFVEVDQGKIGQFIKNTAIAFARAFKAAGYPEYISWALTGICDGDDCNQLEHNAEIPGGIMTPTLYLAGSAAAMIIASITLIMAIGMFLVRNVVMWLLVILSPLAFAAYVLPSTKKAFLGWWRQLLQWAFIGVTMSFFLYLATVMSYAANKIEIPLPSGLGEMEMADLINQISTLVVKTMFPAIVMIIGLFLSAQGGNKFAGMALMQAKKIGNWSKGLAAGAIAATGGYVAGKTWGGAKTFFGKIGTSKTLFGKDNETLRYKTGRWIENKLHKPGMLTGHRIKKVAELAEKYEKELKTAHSDRLHDEAKILEKLVKRPKPAGIIGIKRIAKIKAIIKELTERGELNNDDYALLIRELENQGEKKTAMEAMKKNPILASESSTLGESKEERLKNLFMKMSDEEKRKVQPGAYKDPLVAQAALSTITHPKEFSSIISNWQNGRDIGDYLASLVTFQRMQAQLGQHVANLIKQALQKPANQAKTGVRYNTKNDEIERA